MGYGAIAFGFALAMALLLAGHAVRMHAGRRAHDTWDLMLHGLIFIIYSTAVLMAIGDTVGLTDPEFMGLSTMLIVLSGPGSLALKRKLAQRS